MLKHWLLKLRVIFDKFVFSRFAKRVLLIIAFIESIFFPIPTDVLLVPMIYENPKNAYKYAFIATIGSVLGGVVGYFLGVAFYAYIIQEVLLHHGYKPLFDSFKQLVDQYHFLAVFIAGFSPIPYKIATISSGILHINFVVFVISSVLARGLRFYLVAFVVSYFSNIDLKFIKRYYQSIIVGLTIIIVLGLVLLESFS